MGGQKFVCVVCEFQVLGGVCRIGLSQRSDVFELQDVRAITHCCMGLQRSCSQRLMVHVFACSGKNIGCAVGRRKRQ